jgi:hypothetical protein
MNLPRNRRLWVAGPARRPPFGRAPWSTRDQILGVLILTLLSLLLTDGSHGWPVISTIWRAVRRFFLSTTKDPFIDN